MVIKSMTRVSILALPFGLIKTQWEQINSLLLLTVKKFIKSKSLITTPFIRV